MTLVCALFDLPKKLVRNDVKLSTTFVHSDVKLRNYVQADSKIRPQIGKLQWPHISTRTIHPQR